MSSDIVLDLTDEEWMRILVPDSDGLPYCCANVSALRDDFYNIVRTNKALTMWNVTSFMRHYKWVIDGHDTPPLVEKVFNQLLQDPAFKQKWEEMEEHYREREEL